MFLQERSESKLLLIFRQLHARMELEEKELSYLDSLEKGYAGELQFDQLLRVLTLPCIIINNLQLEVKQSFFPIDSFVITGEKNYLFEVKNYEGDYFVDEQGNWYTVGSRIPIKNPLHQLTRQETLLK